MLQKIVGRSFSLGGLACLERFSGQWAFIKEDVSHDHGDAEGDGDIRDVVGCTSKTQSMSMKSIIFSGRDPNLPMAPPELTKAMFTAQ